MLNKMLKLQRRIFSGVKLLRLRVSEGEIVYRVSKQGWKTAKWKWPFLKNFSKLVGTLCSYTPMRILLKVGPILQADESNCSPSKTTEKKAKKSGLFIRMKEKKSRRKESSLSLAQPTHMTSRCRGCSCAFQCGKIQTRPNKCPMNFGQSNILFRFRCQHPSRRRWFHDSNE